MLTSKQRAYLRKLANPMDAVVRVGKAGVSPELVKSVDEALEARELIKVELLQNCPDGVWQAADMIAARARAEVAQVIGKKIVLYRRAKEKPAIVLPK